MPLFLHSLSLKLLRLKNSAIFFFFISFLLITSTLAYMLEPDTFGNWFNALYWVMTTMATVGYGDFFAHTFAGKLLTILIYIFGIGLLSLIIGKIIDSVGQFHRQRRAGKLKYYGKQHFVFINWSKKARYAIEELLTISPAAQIVIIDEADQHPYEHDQVHFVSGDPSSGDILEKAGIASAQAAVIFADNRIDEPSLVDGKSLLIVSSIESIAPQVHTTVEIMLEKHIQNFKHANVNEFVLSHDAVARLAVRSALNDGSVEIFSQLLSRQHGADVFPVPVSPQWRTYEDAFLSLLKQGATLISDRGDMSINTKLQEPIPADAKLYMVCDIATYKQITKGA
ncbi:potassium channel family protein [Paenibacillus montanisoli]|uniref:Ion transporter n=1 Tax=Paenibacillus montanisoli TaxID=2081970 RepID=A0A328U981_9BACL|nr:potassium channel family protein [Paenibacillus montanisoli]RAP78373.1 ion transporter [Paenibacillus montanisoli]